MGNNYPCHDCCEGETGDCQCGDCYCEDCACPGTGTGTGTDTDRDRVNAPCCIQVKFTEFVNDECAGTDNCENQFNRTFYLYQGRGGIITGTGTDEDTDTGENCIWSAAMRLKDKCEESLICGADEITFEVELIGSNYFATVTLGDMKWQKNFGTTPPNCCGFNEEELAEISSSSECDTSYVECLITSGSGGEPCGDNPGCLEEYLSCSAPCCFEVAVEGVTAGDTQSKHCTCVNDVYSLPHLSGCVWRKTVPACHCIVRLEIEGADEPRTGTSVGSGDYVVFVELGLPVAARWEKAYDEKPCPADWVNEELAYVSGVCGAGCGYGSSTVIINPRYGATCLNVDYPPPECDICHCCPPGPLEFEVTISGMVEGSGGCSAGPGEIECDALNGVFIMTFVEHLGGRCTYRYTFGGSVCGYSEFLYLYIYDSYRTIDLWWGGNQLALYSRAEPVEAWKCEELNLDLPRTVMLTRHCANSSATFHIGGV